MKQGSTKAFVAFPRQREVEILIELYEHTRTLHYIKFVYLDLYLTKYKNDLLYGDIVYSKLLLL